MISMDRLNYNSRTASQLHKNIQFVSTVLIQMPLIFFHECISFAIFAHKKVLIHSDHL